jgi:hypothetical protein
MYCEISTVGVLHYNAKSGIGVIEEGSVIGNNIGRVDGG